MGGCHVLMWESIGSNCLSECDSKVSGKSGAVGKEDGFAK
jgi:hypothetical protein